MQQGVFGQTQPPKGAVELPGSWCMSCALSTGRPEHAPATPTAHSHRIESQTSGLEMQLQPDPHLDTPGPHPQPCQTPAAEANPATPSMPCVLSSGNWGPQYHTWFILGKATLCSLRKPELIMCKSIWSLKNVTHVL